MPKKTTQQSEVFSFRLPNADREWLEATAQANGVEVAQVVRWAVIAIKQYIDAHGGRIHLPLDIRTMWEQRSTNFPALRAADAADLPAAAAATLGPPQTDNYIPPRKRSTAK